MFISKTGVNHPQLIVFSSFGAHSHNFAVHSLCISHLSVLRHTQALAELMAIVSPNCFSVFAVDSSHITVRRHNNHLVFHHYRNTIARTKHISRFAIVPLPFEFAVFLVNATQISVPCSKYHIVAVDHRCCLTIILQVGVLPQAF